MENSNVRVRMAPSPTGYLHLGTARTALFNYLHAKKTGGKFIMRIEDTDKERSKPEFELDILQGLEWIGIEWDEGVFVEDAKEDKKTKFHQSARGDIYRKYIELMLDKGSAFYCAHTKEELGVEQKQQMDEKQAPRHLCDHKNKGLEKGIIRFNNSESEEIVFTDGIKGEIKFKADLLGDFSIARSIDDVLYNFAVVVDDDDMEITDVIRGDDHISNTPKQILLQKALNFTSPNYFHIPLILDKDRSKLSKRDNQSVSVNDYKQVGYLHTVMFNYLSLLGWHPKDDKEIMTKDEIIQEFEISHVQKSPAIFDIEKLNWMNLQKIQSMTSLEISTALEGIDNSEKTQKFLRLSDSAINLEKIRIRGPLMNIIENGEYLIELPNYEKELLQYKNQEFKDVKFILEKIYGIINDIPEDKWGILMLSGKVMEAKEAKDNKGRVLHPLRVAVSGKQSSPPPFEIMDVLGRNESLSRVKVAIDKIDS